MRRTPSIILTGLLLLPVIACNDGDSVGRLTAIVHDAVEVEGTATDDPAKRLNADDEVTTDGQGAVELKLDERVKLCHEFSDSALTVHPKSPSDVLIRFTKGKHWCQSKVPTDCDGRCKFSTATGVQFDSKGDPVFGVEIDGDRVSVQVEVGVMTVTSPDGQVDVPAGFQTVVVPGLPPEDPVIFEVPPELGDLIGNLRDLEDLPDISAPSVDSDLLAAALERGVLVMWVDEAGIRDPGTERFVFGFAETIRTSWRLEVVDVLFEPFEEVRAALAAGEIGLIVTPRPEDDWGPTLLFVDDGGAEWYLASAEPAATEAMRDFVLRTTELGIFGRLHFDAFGRAPVVGP